MTHRVDDALVTEEMLQAGYRATGCPVSEHGPGPRNREFFTQIYLAMHGAALEAAGVAELREDAEFLCARVRELEGEMRDDDELTQQYFGHVLPALARMESALANQGKAQADGR